MPLAALIIADDESSEVAAKVALLPILGVPLAEYQARIAIEAGATHLVICTKQLPATLVASIDRLRASGTNVALARTASEAADAIHPDETVLMFALGCVPNLELVKELLAINRAAIVTEPLEARALDQELIDADHGWAGLAKIDGNLVRQTAAVLGDWELAPTLLRLAIQAGADRLDASKDGKRRVERVRTAAGALSVGSASVSANTGPVWMRFIATRLAGYLSKTKLPAAAAIPVPILVSIAALMTIFMGWRGAGLSIACLIPLAGSISQALADAALARSKALTSFWKAQPWIMRAALFGAIAVNPDAVDWVSIVLVLWLVWMLWEGETNVGRWRVDDLLAALVVLVGIVAGHPVAGLTVALGLALAARIGERLAAKG